MYTPQRKSLHPIFLLVVFLYASFGVTAHSETRPPKWGKVSKAEIELKTVPFNPEAHAVVLAKWGHLTFLNGNFVVKKHVRIKILDQEGVSQGDVALPYYSKNRLEKIDQVKAHTLEVLENGKVIKHEIDKKQVFDVQEDENWSEVRFALPAVKPGSIIEYTYNLYSENFTFLEGWVFQSDIPTLKSSFKADVPDYLRYQLLMHGTRMVKKYQHTEPTNEWELENLPALKAEPYTYNLLDYAEKISFQLKSYDKRDYNGVVSNEKVFVDWQSISQEVLSTPGFRSYLNSNKAVEEILAIFPLEKDSLALARNLYAYVQGNYSWNERYGLLPDQSLKETMATKTANGTAINLLLVSLLQRAGFDAFPAYISTKNHGRINPELPFLSQFNHVIVQVHINGKGHLLDAAGNKLAFGILPVVDLNNKALALSKKGANWIDISDHSKSSTIIAYTAELATGKYKFDCNWTGFEALRMAPEIIQEEENRIIISGNPHLIQDSVHIEEAISEQNRLKAQLFFSGEAATAADKIYYSLPQFGLIHDNPFKDEVRHLPVDLGYTSSRILVYNILLPEGYSIEEMPENLSMVTPGKEAMFIYQAMQQGNLLNIQVRLNINESFIPVERYLSLRELYSKMINHCQKPYVISKN